MKSQFKLVSLGSLLAAVTFVGNLEGCKSRIYNKTSSGPAATTADRVPLSKDGQWPSIKSAREADYANYLSRMENGQEAKDINWYHDLPLGLQGLPFLVLKVAVESYPDIWGSEAEGRMGSVLGVGPHPLDYVTKSNNPKGAWLDWGTELKPRDERHGLPYGFVSYPDVTKDPASIAGTENTFFSCAACHTSRIVTKVAGKPAIRYYMGGPNTEMEAQKFAGLIYKTSAKLTNIEKETNPTKIKPNIAEVGKFLWRLAFYECRNYKPNLGSTGVSECNDQKLKILGLDFFSKMKQYRSQVGEEKAESVTSEYLTETEKNLTAQSVTESAYEQLGGEPSKPQCGIEPPNPKTLAPLKLIKAIVGSGFKVRVMMNQLGETYPFRPQNTGSDVASTQFTSFFRQQEQKTPPPVWDKRSGQMDAFGLVQGVVFLNAMRPDLVMFRYLSPLSMNKLNNDFGSPAGSPQSVAKYDLDIANKWAGTEQIQEKSACKTGEWNKNVGNWITNAAALSDIKSLYRSEDEFHANWDGNQGAGARVLASGLSSVGDPKKVFTEMHETQNAFINKLPAPPYPFDDANTPEFYQSALRGQALFNQDKACASCHTPRNKEIYNVGTDLNRAMAVWAPETRLSLIALVTAACQRGKDRANGITVKEKILGENKKEAETEIKLEPWIKNASGIDSSKGDKYWCELVDGNMPDGAKGYMDDIYRPLRGPGSQDPSMPIGYKADPMYALWADAPYMHNGSVPTLREMLMTKSQRDRALSDRGQANKFTRGNLVYDFKNAGFMAVPPNPLDYVAGSNTYSTTFDVTLRGNSNAGHEFFHREYENANGQWKGMPGTEFSEDDKNDIINYLKLK
jgi:cytochrome c551/c552